MNTLIKTVPSGNASVYTLQHKHVFTNTATTKAVSPDATIDGSLSRDVTATDVAQLQPGLVMGKITTGGKYRPAIVGQTNAAVSAGTVTSITVTSAVATELQRLVTAAGASVVFNLVGPPSAAGTVASQSITVSSAGGTAATITSAVLAASVTKSLIMPSDGAGTPVTLIPDGYGIPVTDQTGASVDQKLTPFFIAGDVDVNQIVNYPADASLKTWLKGQLRVSADFTFSDDR